MYAGYAEETAGYVGQLKGVEDYKARSDKSHYRLGLTYEGIFRVLERIDFLQRRPVPYRGTCADWEFRKWMVHKDYARPSSMSWLDEESPIREDKRDDAKSVGFVGVTWYDCCAHVRNWLNNNGHGAHSMCEVVLLDDRFADLRTFVGVATVFFSHEQKNTVVQHGIEEINSGETNVTSDLWCLWRCVTQGRLDEGAFIWTDVFSLRQCVQDFDIYAIMHLIQEIGDVVASVPERAGVFTYTTRSFCIVELFAAIKSSSRLFVKSQKGMKSDVQRRLVEHPVNSKEATTRNLADKKQIDDFIVKEVDGGFETLNRIAAQALLDACAE